MSHTPGPWIDYDEDGIITGEMPVTSEDGEGVCCVIAGPNAKGNATLIKAAPDLLAACEKLRAAWAKTDVQADFADKMVLGERFAAIDAAIAKARGES